MEAEKYQIAERQEEAKRATSQETIFMGCSMISRLSSECGAWESGWLRFSQGGLRRKLLQRASSMN